MSFSWDWAFALEILPLMVDALQVTVLATMLGGALALIGGLPLALAGLSNVRPVRGCSRAVTEFVRGTPLLIQLYALFYVLPGFGLRFEPLTTGVLALGIHYSTYTAEVYRAGIQAVPPGQYDAALALGLGRRHLISRIILPQAIPPVLPALGNCLVAMFKDTPLLSTITVLELLNAAKELGAGTFRYLEPFTIVGALFLVVSLLAAAGIRLVENRLDGKAGI